MSSSNSGWVTINGVHVFIENGGIITKGPANLVNKHIKFIESDREDGITLHSSLETWARNPNGIRKASTGVKPDGSIRSISQGEVVKSEIIEQYIKDSPKVKKTIYRGVHDLSDEDFKRYTKVGNEIDQRGTSSWSTDRGVAMGNVHGSNNNNLLFIQQGSNNARRLTDAYTGTSSEKEVIMSSKASQRVVRTEDGKFYTRVFVEEVSKHTK